MTTLAIMSARIASELRRSNVSAQILAAINSAIEALESDRFYFNESRDITFNTVIDQEFYASADSALIPRIIKFDYVKVLLNESLFTLNPITPERIEYLSNNATAEGQPLGYCYYGEKIRLYPIPPAVYPIRIGAVIKMPAPATDGEADNPWMTKAERAVRSRAKYELYEHVLLDKEMADKFNPENITGPTHEAIRQLRSRTNQLTQQNGWLVAGGDW